MKLIEEKMKAVLVDTQDQSWGQASVKPREASVENSSPSSLYVILRNDTMFVFFTMLIG